MLSMLANTTSNSMIVKQALGPPFYKCENAGSTLVPPANCAIQWKERRERSWLHLLFIQGTPPVGERAVLPQRLGELRVEFVSQRQGDAFPHQDENHNHRSLTGVASSLPHQTQ